MNPPTKQAPARTPTLADSNGEHPQRDESDIGGIPSTLDAGLFPDQEGRTRVPTPVDSDWPAREQAARDQQKAEDAEADGDDRYGDPGSVKDAGVMESLGKAVSSSVLDADEEDTDAAKAAANKKT